jgi:hypothetical protein
VTNGLSIYNQKEILFVLKCLPNEKPDEFPTAPLTLFKIVLDYAKQGVVVDEGLSLAFDIQKTSKRTVRNQNKNQNT